MKKLDEKAVSWKKILLFICKILSIFFFNYFLYFNFQIFYFSLLSVKKIETSLAMSMQSAP
jgi:hypothetical protein